ncbi:MAG: energy transducer TonB [Bacteroidaceae bacterium]|nr:energy transducer TonB [Bacteroidaceae bacterium]
MIYILKSAIILALLYSCYIVFLSHDTFHRFKRFILHAILLLAFLLPACRITKQNPLALSPTVQQIYLLSEKMEEKQTLYAEQKEGAIPSDASLIGSQLTEQKNLSPSDFLWWIYIGGFVFFLLYHLKNLASVSRQIRGGLRLKDRQGNTLVVKAGDFAPFSFLRWIVINLSDYEKNKESILLHEQAHIHFGHSYDIMLLQLAKSFQWFNPFIYLMEREMKAVHEYEADEEVIHQGIDAQTYQLLIVSKAVGGRLQTLANNFNHSLIKSRIMMMNKKPTSKAAILKSFCLLPVAAFSLMAFAPVESTDIPTDPPTAGYKYSFAKVDSLEFDESKPMPGSADHRYMMAQYWLEKNMQYPEEAKQRGIGGNIKLHPYVKADGSFTNVKFEEEPDPVLKAEVMRLLRLMPKKLMKGLLPLTTKEGPAYLCVAIYDKNLQHQPFNERKSLVVYNDAVWPNKNPKVHRRYYTITLPLGVKVSDSDGGSYITNRRDLLLGEAASDYKRVAIHVRKDRQPIMQLNGKTFTKDNVPYLLADNLKELKTTRVSDSEFIVNLITE